MRRCWANWLGQGARKGATNTKMANWFIRDHWSEQNGNQFVWLSINEDLLNRYHVSSKPWWKTKRISNKYERTVSLEHVWSQTTIYLSFIPKSSSNYRGPWFLRRLDASEVEVWIKGHCLVPLMYRPNPHAVRRSGSHVVRWDWRLTAHFMHLPMETKHPGCLLHPFVTYVSEGTAVFRTGGHFSVWNQDLANSSSTITKGQPSRLQASRFLLSSYFSKNTSAARRQCVGLSHQRRSEP